MAVVRRTVCDDGPRAMRCLMLAALLPLSGCAFEAPRADPPRPDPALEAEFEALFEAEVYPILVRDCGFPECHGDPRRFFRVYGPRRTRQLPTTIDDDPATAEEIASSFDRARSMLASAESAEDSLLLRKPLEVDQGGAPHMGIDQHGRDIFASTEHEDYRTLLAWASLAFGDDSP